MFEEKDWKRLDAHIPPVTTLKAWSVFNAINSNSEDCSLFLSGMAVSFIGLDKEKLTKLAMTFNGVDLERYGKSIDYFKDKLKDFYKRKERDGKRSKN